MHIQTKCTTPLLVFNNHTLTPLNLHTNNLKQVPFDTQREISKMLIRVNVAEVCDARDDDSSTGACYKKLFQQFKHKTLFWFYFERSFLINLTAYHITKLGKTSCSFG